MHTQHVYTPDNMPRRGLHLTKLHRIIHLPEMMQLVQPLPQSLKAAYTVFIHLIMQVKTCYRACTGKRNFIYI
jgi:hypothetical protein